MANAPCPNGRVTPAIDKVLRDLITVAFESGYKDLDFDRLQSDKAAFAINALLGISREDCNAVMWDELTNIANKIRRAQDLKETQIAKF
ncbi:hypothetical protein NXY55_10120 [Aeromonas veronii]|nr:hypothetical protein [Aeromonas veronii]